MTLSPTDEINRRGRLRMTTPHEFLDVLFAAATPGTYVTTSEYVMNSDGTPKRKPNGDPVWTDTGNIASVTDLASIVIKPRDQWFTTQPRTNPKRGGEDNTAEVTELIADFDFEGSSDNKSLAPFEDLADVSRFCEHHVQLSASAVVNSGHGAHFYWLLTEPLDHEAGKRLMKRFDLYLRECARTEGKQLDAMHDTARVFRLPGSINLKNPDAPVDVTVEHLFPDRRYTLDDFDWVPEISTDITRPTPSTAPLPDPLPSRVAQHYSETCGDRSIDMVHLVNDCIREHFTESQTWTAVRKHQPSKAKYASRGATKWWGIVAGLIDTADKYTAPEVEVTIGQGAGKFVGRDGLKAAQLRNSVHAQLILARGVGRALWRYRDGVWTPGGEDAVQAAVTMLMEDDYRPAHARNVIEATLANPPRTIDDTPVPRYINLKNGLLNWRTGNLDRHDPDLPTVNQLPHEWDENATCPRAEEFMGEVFHPDAIDLAWEIIGYAMFDGNPFQKAALFVGTGANGKGEYLRIIEHLLGADNVSAVPLQALGSDRFASASLYGKLANIAGDLPSARVQDSSMFKKITGGDLIHADIKFRQPFSFTARAFPLFSGNEIPGSDDVTHGYLRRWLVVEFPNLFPEDAREPGLTERLATEAPGILVKAVKGLRQVMDRGQFDQPESVRLMYERFKRHIDTVHSFIDDCVVENPSGNLNRTDLYETYKVWTQQEGLRPLSQKRFTPSVRAVADEYGWQLEELTIRGVRRWVHISLSVHIDRTDDKNPALRPIDAKWQ